MFMASRPTWRKRLVSSGHFPRITGRPMLALYPATFAPTLKWMISPFCTCRCVGRLMAWMEFSPEHFDELQAFDRESWRHEVIGHEELFIDIHDHLPPEMIYERELLICRL